MKKIALSSIGFLLISINSFAQCFNGTVSSERSISSVTQVVLASKDIVCTQESDSYDASLYVITLSQKNQTAKLVRTGGGWGQLQDLGTSSVSIQRDSKGYVPNIDVQSVDGYGNQTDELRLIINGSVATATIRLDYSNRPSEYKKIQFKCDN